MGREEAADRHQRHDIPFQELRIAGGGAPARLPGALVAIIGTGRFRNPGGVSGLMFSPDGTTLATSGPLRQWCLESGQLLHEFPGAGLGGSGRHTAIGHGSSTNNVATFSQDGRMLAWRHGNWQSNIAVWNGFDARVLVGPIDSVSSVVFSPNGRWLVAVRWAGDSDYLEQIDLWDVTNGNLVRTFGQYSVPASFNGFGQRGTMLAAQEGERGIILRLDTLEEVHSVLCSHLAISPDENTFAWIHGKREVSITPIDASPSYGGWGPEPVTRVVYSPDSQWVAAWIHHSVPREEAARRKVRLWHVPTGERGPVLEFGMDTSRFVAKGYVGDFAFSPNGRRIVLAGHGRTLRMYEVPTGELVWEFRELSTEPLPESEHREHEARVVFGPDGRTVLFGSFLRGHPGREMTLHDAATGKEIAGTEVLRNAAEAAYSPDGRLLAIRQANQRTRVTLWSVAHGKERFPDDGHAGAIRDLAFSSDGHLLASCADDGTTRLWDVSTGRLVHTLAQPENTPERIAFFPDGQCLASSGPTGTQVWDVATGRLLRDIPAASSHKHVRRAVAFGGNGRILAAPHPAQGPVEDVTTRFWDLATGNEMLLLDEAPEGFPVAFSADGRWFASDSRGVVSLWDLVDRRKTREIETEMEHLAVGVFSPDGASFAAVNGNRRSSTPTLGVWDSETGRKKFALSPTRCYANAAFTPDGKHVTAIDWAKNLRLFNVESGAEVALHAVGLEQWGAPLPFALSPTGRHVAVGMSDGTIHIHRLAGRPAYTSPVPPVEPTVEQ